MIKTTNYPVYGGGNLTVPQWVISGTRIDTRSTGDVYDWFQTRTKDLFASATSDVKTTLNAITTYSLDGTLNAGAITNQTHAAATTIVFNPFFDQYRTDSSANDICGNVRTKFLTNSLYHEGRHAYQGLIATTDNDADQDYLVKAVAIAPTDILIDSTTVRNVCNNTANLILQLGYSGDTIFDPPGAPARTGDPGFASYAWEMDAYTFAAMKTPAK